ncbi:MAG: dienelactone hydrolase family protein [bacterium]|nr:dienelactone hydrolase family protein [bacterium]
MEPLAPKFSQPGTSDLGDPEPISPIFADGRPTSPEIWDAERLALKQRWNTVLGTPSFDIFDMRSEAVQTFEQPGYTGTVFKQPTGPETRQTLLLMEPTERRASPSPGMVIPFYEPDRMAGISLETLEPITEAPNIQFARHLVQQGYVVVCSQAFPYNTVPEPEDNKGFAWWQAGAEKLLSDNPDWTGMGKLAWDASRAVDLLLDQHDIDHDRIGIMGHSLGGKIALYTGALDERLQATICSDPGIGFAFTNWDAPWYLGEQIDRPDFALAHHHLLALHAPRPFFLFGGEADRPATWQYILEAQKVYDLYGCKEAIGFYHHGAGHRPTEESLHISYRWLAERFGLEDRPWEL